jgi:hypothetical protein
MAAARSQGGRWALFPDRTASRPSARALRPRSLAVMASTTCAHPIPSTSGCDDLAEEIGRDLANLVARLRVIAAGCVHDDGVAKAKAFAQPLAEIKLERACSDDGDAHNPARAGKLEQASDLEPCHSQLAGDLHLRAVVEVVSARHQGSRNHLTGPHERGLRRFVPDSPDFAQMSTLDTPKHPSNQLTRSACLRARGRSLTWRRCK